MILLVVGLAIFIGIHIIPTRPDLRAKLIKSLGHGAYKAFFSLVALAGLLLIVAGKYDAPDIILYQSPVWTYQLVPIFMLPAFILLAAAYIPNNIRRFVRNPMLTAVKLWAVAHILANGDVASLLIFVSLLAYSIYDVIQVKKRGKKPVYPKQIILLDVATVATGVILFGIALWLHQAAFGVNAWWW